MKRAVSALGCIMLLLVFAASTFAATPIRIGGLFAVTGPASFLGEPEKKTLEMLVKDINGKGGVNGSPVELVIYDTQGDVTKAVQLATKLIKNDKVAAIIGPSTTGETLAIIPVVEKERIPLISCAAGIKITEPVKKWVFKTPANDHVAAEKILNYASRLKQKNLALASGIGQMHRSILDREPGIDRAAGGVDGQDDGREPLLRQSEREEIYQAAVALLRSRGRVYACDCSRTEIGGERYSGRCRDLRLPETSGRGLRVRIDPGPVSAMDLLAGPIEQAPSDQCGDLLIKDRDGHWTYQFAATVDDWRQGVTLVIRGADLESSTGRQVALARLLGRTEPPIFLHHPLILDSQGRKLSKSAGDTGVRELRGRGMSAADVIGLAASAVGLLPKRQPLQSLHVPVLFDRGSPSLG